MSDTVERLTAALERERPEHPALLVLRGEAVAVSNADAVTVRAWQEYTRRVFGPHGAASASAVAFMAAVIPPPGGGGPDYAYAVAAEVLGERLRALCLRAQQEGQAGAERLREALGLPDPSRVWGALGAQQREQLEAADNAGTVPCGRGCCLVTPASRANECPGCSGHDLGERCELCGDTGKIDPGGP